MKMNRLVSIFREPQYIEGFFGGWGILIWLFVSHLITTSLLNIIRNKVCRGKLPDAFFQQDEHRRKTATAKSAGRIAVFTSPYSYIETRCEDYGKHSLKRP